MYRWVGGYLTGHCQTHSLALSLTRSSTNVLFSPGQLAAEDGDGHGQGLGRAQDTTSGNPRPTQVLPGRSDQDQPWVRQGVAASPARCQATSCSLPRPSANSLLGRSQDTGRRRPQYLDQEHASPPSRPGYSPRAVLNNVQFPANKPTSGEGRSGPLASSKCRLRGCAAWEMALANGPGQSIKRDLPEPIPCVD
jgi:hypothetical protein